MPDTTTLNEVTRSPLDGTEAIRLATTGANWKTKLSSLVGLTFLATVSSNFNSGSGNIEVYVTTTGSDSADGSAAHPFATIQHALDYISDYDFEHIYGGSIFVADGTYSVASLILPHMVNLNLTQNRILIQGNPASPANVVLNYGPSVSFLGTDGIFYIDGFQLNIDDTDDGFWARGTCNISIDDIIFNMVGVHGNNNCINASNNGKVFVGPITNSQNQLSSTTGFATFMMFAQDSAQIQDTGGAWTINNAVNFFSVGSVGNQATVLWGFDGDVTNPGNLQGRQFFNNGLASYYGGPPGGDRSSMFGTVRGSADIHGNLIDHKYDIYTPTSGTTVNLLAVTHNNILNPAAGLATLTVVLPGFAIDGEVVSISTSQTITVLTMQAAATFGGGVPTIIGAPATLTAASSVLFTFDSASNTWYIS